MHTHLDTLVAQSVAHERELDVRRALHHREIERLRPVAERRRAVREHHRWHDALVRLHLRHAPSH